MKEKVSSEKCLTAKKSERKRRILMKVLGFVMVVALMPVGWRTGESLLVTGDGEHT